MKNFLNWQRENAKREKARADRREREAIYGAMLDMGFELPSLLEPSRSLKDGKHE